MRKENCFGMECGGFLVFFALCLQSRALQLILYNCHLTIIIYYRAANFIYVNPLGYKADINVAEIA